MMFQALTRFMEKMEAKFQAQIEKSKERLLQLLEKIDESPVSSHDGEATIVTQKWSSQGT